MSSIQYYGTGRRKTSTARVHLRPGTGTIRINGREFGHIEQVITAAQVAAITPVGTTVTVAISGFPTAAKRSTTPS